MLFFILSLCDFGLDFKFVTLSFFISLDQFLFLDFLGFYGFFYDFQMVQEHSILFFEFIQVLIKVT